MKALWIITEAVVRICSSKGLQLYLKETSKQLLGTLFLQNTSGGWFSDYICLAERVKFAFLIFNYGENSKCNVKHVFWKVLKNSMELLTSPFLVMLQNFLLLLFFTFTKAFNVKYGTPRTLQGTQGTWVLGTQALESLEALYKHLKSGWTLRHLETRRALGHFI